MNVDVSVIIPVFNSVNTIERAIQSTQNQGVKTEVIIVDDGSNDGSQEFIKHLVTQYDGHFRFISSETNLGASGARNLALKTVETEYVAFLDADDLWLENKLVAQLKVAKSDREIVMVTCDSFKVSPQGRVLSRGHAYRKPVEGYDGWRTLLSYNFMPTPTVLTKIDAIKKAGYFDPNLEVGEDLDLWLGIAKQGKIGVVNQVLTQYFDYSGSLMKRGGVTSAEYILDMIIGHMNDPRLSEKEKDKILSRRYFEIGLQCLGFSQTKSMNHYFSLAEQHGFDTQTVKKIKMKYKLKSLFGVK